MMETEQEMKAETCFDSSVKVQVAVRNLFCYLCHQSFPDSNSFQFHNHYDFFTNPNNNNNNNNNLNSGETSNALLSTSNRKRTRRPPHSPDFFSFDDSNPNSDTEQSPKGAINKKPRSTAKKHGISSRVKSKMKSSTKENRPIQHKNKNKSAVQNFLAKMGDFFHCTRCFDTFYKLRDLIMHFKKCDSSGSRSSVTSFKQFKTQQKQSECDSKSAECEQNNPDSSETLGILNENKNNNKNDDYEMMCSNSASPPTGEETPPPLIEITDDEDDNNNNDDNEEEEENGNSDVDSESDSLDLNPDLDSEMSETGFSHLSSPPSNLSADLNEVAEEEHTELNKELVEVEEEEESGESLLFSCPDCSMGFTRKRYMLDHQRRIHREKSHKCPLCPYATYFRHILVTHLKFSHPGDPVSQQPQFHTVRCLHPNCDRTFSSRAQMKQHRLDDHGNPDSLDNSTTNNSNPNSDPTNSNSIYLNAQDESLTCFECGKTLSSVYTYQKHVNSHQGLKPYKCGHCEKSYVSRAHWIAHEKTHQTEFKCPHAKSDREPEREPESNSNASGNETESNCDNLIFSCQAELNDHLNCAHPENIVCTLCGLSFSSAQKHYQHSLKHREKTHKCSECGKLFARMEHLRRHMSSAIHGERTKIRFACDIPGCWKEYARAENLEEHMNIFHVGIQKYICECGRGDFLNSTSFTKHRKSHMNKPPEQDQEPNAEPTQIVNKPTEIYNV